MINNVNIMGRLTADPELKTTASGNSVISFTVAVDRDYVKQGEERKADFISCVAWKHTAEFISRYFGKGSLIAVQGQIQTRTYQAKDGSNRYVTEVLVEKASFTGEKRDNSGSQQNGGGYQQPNQQRQNGSQQNGGGYQQPNQQRQNGSQQNGGGYQQPNQQYPQNAPQQQSGGYQQYPQNAPQQQSAFDNGYPDEYPPDDDLPF